MRILVANKFWYSRGGQERVAMDEARWLAAAGHEVAHFAPAHPENEASEWSGYAPPYLELGRGGGLSASEKALAAVRLFYNAPARRQFARLLDDFRPDVVHIHGIHRQLSSSVLFETIRRGIPVVQTLHDYHHVCASGDLLRGGSETCIPRSCGTLNTGPAIANRCCQGSAAVSMLLGSETSWAKLSGIYERAVRRFISPSRFLACLITQAGWTRRPIDLVPNATDIADSVTRQGTGDYFVYAGRLSREKGVRTLLEAARRSGVPVRVAGTGPEEAALRAAAPPSVEFLGHVSVAQVGQLLSRARAAVLPSECLENLPMGVIEAMAIGVPVIATDRGGIPELLRYGENGFVYPAGDVGALETAMRRLWEDAELAERMGRAGAGFAAVEFAADTHVERLERVYRLAMESRP
jgi:glycosyltransferase involved in cell wall biosynthesis